MNCYIRVLAIHGKTFLCITDENDYWFKRNNNTIHIMHGVCQIIVSELIKDALNKNYTPSPFMIFLILGNFSKWHLEQISFFSKSLKACGMQTICHNHACQSLFISSQSWKLMTLACVCHTKHPITIHSTC